jgi:hypothetical protein
MDNFRISGSLLFILSNKEGKNFMTDLSQNSTVEDSRLLECENVSLCISLCCKELLVSSSLGSGSPRKRDVLKDRVCQSHATTQHHIPEGLDLPYIF